MKLALVILAVAMPVPVMVTFAVAVAVGVVVDGVYCTMIVQLPPGATAAPLTQVPPVFAKVPPAAPTFVTVGVAVRVRGPVAVAALVTVIVPVSTAVLAVVGASVGEGAEIATAAPVTVNGIVFVFPIGVARPRFRIPSVAPFGITRFAVTEVGLTTVRPVAVIPDPPRPFTPVAPVRLVPVKVTGTVEPRAPEFGAIDVRVGPCTVNGSALLAAAAPATLTVTLWAAVVEALAEMVKFAVAVVGLVTFTALTVIPKPETATVVSPVMKLLPVSVTATVVPRTPVAGEIEVNVGVGGIVTVKATVLLTPPGAVTVTFLAVPAANAEMVRVVCTSVALTTVMGPTVMPPPDTVTAVVPVKPLPKRSTGTGVPCPRSADAGTIEVSTGPSTV